MSPNLTLVSGEPTVQKSERFEVGHNLRMLLDNCSGKLCIAGPRAGVLRAYRISVPFLTSSACAGSVSHLTRRPVMTILAIDLGKFKSAACVLNPTPGITLAPENLNGGVKQPRLNQNQERINAY